MKVHAVTIAQMFSTHKSIFEIGQGFNKNAAPWQVRRLLQPAKNAGFAMTCRPGDRFTR